MWDNGIKGLAEMVKVHLAQDNSLGNSAKAIFAVFVEQVTNMLMYSVEKENFSQSEKAVSIGMLVLGYKENAFFIQTRNAINNETSEVLKEKIDYLNSLDKKELRQYHKECVRVENGNSESQGAGLGLIEIARRSTAPIGYSFEQTDEKLSYFTMYAEVSQIQEEK